MTQVKGTMIPKKNRMKPSTRMEILTSFLYAYRVKNSTPLITNNPMVIVLKLARRNPNVKAVKSVFAL